METEKQKLKMQQRLSELEPLADLLKVKEASFCLVNYFVPCLFNDNAIHAAKYTSLTDVTSHVISHIDYDQMNISF